MTLDLVLLAVGIGLLIGGGDVLVRGASGLARALGVSPLVVGLSVVAFGTSAPELAVNVLAALGGSGDISFGNIMGSNMANIGLVLALTALVRPIEIKAPLIRREIPMMLLATATAAVLGVDALVRGADDAYDLGDGLVLLLLFGVFIYYTVIDVFDGRGRDEFLENAQALAPEREKSKIPLHALLLVVGLVALTAGGRLAVASAVGLARGFGVSEALIGMTLIAVGTSLPELVTSLVAAARGELDLAVGNVIGSNIFNLLFVLGVTATIAPVRLPSRGYLDIAVVVLLSVMLLAAALLQRRRIVRSEGVLLLVVYVAYVGWRALSAG